MSGKLPGWIVATLLLGTMVYAIAEEITLTTYYPSPRGVYNELRTLGNVQIGNIAPPGDVGGPPTPAPRLYLRQEYTAVDQHPAVLIEYAGPASTPGPVTVDGRGNVGIGTVPPATGAAKLTVAGTIESTAGGMKFPDGTTQSSAGLAQPTVAVVTASRSDGTVYQNTSGKARFIAVEAIGGLGSRLDIGPTSPPSIAVSGIGSVRGMMIAWVPTRWYYKLDAAGSTLERWVEYDF